MHVNARMRSQSEHGILSPGDERQLGIYLEAMSMFVPFVYAYILRTGMRTCWEPFYQCLYGIW